MDDSERCNLDIRRQVEYWFSDTQLPKDLRLWKIIGSHAEGWVPLTELCGWPRMRDRHLARVPEEARAATVAAAICNSTELEVRGDGQAVRRRVALLRLPTQSELVVASLARTVHACPVGTTLDIEDVTRAFAQYGEVAAVRRARCCKRSRGGPGDPANLLPEVLVEFNDEAAASACLKAAE
eukprot:gene7458-8883_t